MSALSNEVASKNLVKGFVQQEKWGKVEELAKQGNTFALAALEHHKKNVTAEGTKHMQNSSRYASKKAAKVSVDFTKLAGPAAAGKNGGGGQSHATPPKPKGHGVKTNVGGGNGPKKTSTTIVNSVSNDKKGKKGGKKNKK